MGEQGRPGVVLEAVPTDDYLTSCNGGLWHGYYACSRTPAGGHARRLHASSLSMQASPPFSHCTSMHVITSRSPSQKHLLSIAFTWDSLCVYLSPPVLPGSCLPQRCCRARTPCGGAAAACGEPGRASAGADHHRRSGCLAIRGGAVCCAGAGMLACSVDQCTCTAPPFCR